MRFSLSIGPRAILILAGLLNLAFVSTASKCEICTKIVDKIFEGLKTTAKSNFGGGNTHWEEKSLGTYAFSETRLVEILDNVCDDNGCHSMVEEYEEAIEQWWFKHYAKKKDTRLQTYLCIERVSGACCPSGKWGPSCASCPASGDGLICNDNGKCDGNGTREGTGRCSCDEGYRGELCGECVEGYFAESSDDTKMKCEACHTGCKSGCTGAGPLGCTECKEEGWIFEEGQGCVDVNECDQESGPCSESEYCTNNEGSYECPACHKACQGCTGGAAVDCVACADGYYQHDDTCKACASSCSKTCTGGTSKDCDACKDGWLWSDENGCQDVNECEENPCSEAEYCLNTPGSHKCRECDNACEGCTGIGDKNCKACAQGYHLVDKKCADINECEVEGACAENERCENLPGSHTCHCKDGYTRKDGACVLKEEKKKKKEGKKSDGPYRGPADCSTCKLIVKNILEAIEATSKSNFGGGNTKWEEQKLGSYAHSETRLVELIDRACGNQDDQDSDCAHMLERYEETLEKWWFKHFSQDKNLDLLTWFCIDRAEICCQGGTYGEKCKPCSGPSDNLCSGRGKCDGDGTRKGTGKCTCDKGYKGDVCSECDKGHYEAAKNNSHVECKACDAVCGESGCFGDGPQGCEDCIKGYEFDEDNDTGCHDIDECVADTFPCKDAETCINNPGSYKCVRCDRSCKGCTDAGADHCVECADRFFNDSGRCKPCDRSCETGCTGPGRADCTGSCKKGYEMKEGEGCVDIDECETGQYHCRGNTYCSNTQGHYQCKRCDKACQDGCNGVGPGGCKNCKPGYEKLEQGGCQDINECATQTHDCTGEHQRCVNVHGSFRCECDEGFRKEPGRCVPIPVAEQQEESSKNKNERQKINSRDDLLHPNVKEHLDLKAEDLVPPDLKDDYVTMEGSINEGLQNEESEEKRDEL